jgi:GMP synthase PP-ATPase subunit
MFEDMIKRLTTAFEIIEKHDGFDPFPDPALNMQVTRELQIVIDRLKEMDKIVDTENKENV